MTPKRTNDFQRLIALVERQLADGGVSVRESVELEEYPGSSLRETDVLLEADVNGHMVRIALECRDQARPQSKTWIDELEGKYRDLPVDKIVAVSKSGFTRGAVEKASRLGIETLTFAEALDESWPAHFKRLYARFLVHRIEKATIGLNYAEGGLDPASFSIDLQVQDEAGHPLGSIRSIVEDDLIPDARRVLLQTIDSHATELLQGPADQTRELSVRYATKDRYVLGTEGARFHVTEMILVLRVRFTLEPATSETRFSYKRHQVMLSTLERPGIEPANAVVLQRSDVDGLVVEAGGGWVKPKGSVPD